MVTISTLNLDTEIIDHLIQEINFLNREGINIQLSQKAAGEICFLGCSVSDEKDLAVKTAHEKTLRCYLANIITDLLMNGITKKYLQRIARTKYHYLDANELKTIAQNAFLYINSLRQNEDLGKMISRHNQILTEVNNYLDSDSNLFLEGFLRFRLKNYVQELEESVENAVDNFLVEQEYCEFIKLLRCLIEIQKPKVDEVHVVIKDQAPFRLFDKELQPVTQTELQEVLFELNQEVDDDDLLLSTLITISPARVILHLNTKTEIIETILNVFRDRAVVCHGCELCREGIFH
ncbi:MAG TPA: putative sporulation protein YtxC [Bacillota bacterium]|nr:putative sporulation protein YtxC [Bacillota bacterium]